MKRVLFLTVLCMTTTGYAGAIYVNAAAAGGGDGSTWAQAWNTAEFAADTPGPNDVYYVKAGTTYSFEASLAWSGSSGVGTGPITLIGVKSGTTNEPPVTSDYATGSDRPLFDFYTLVSGRLIVGDYWYVKNMRIIGNATTSFTTTEKCVVEGCYVYNNSGSADRTALEPDAYSTIIECELISTNGAALAPAGNAVRVTTCYIHDSATGYAIAGYGALVDSVVWGCTTGVTCTGIAPLVYGNTIGGCTNNVTGSVDTYALINNIIVDADTAEVAWTADATGLASHNCWGASPTLTNFTLGLDGTNISTDPNLTDPNGDDFSIGTDSVAFDAGVQVDATVGVANTNYVNIGAYQTDANTVASGATAEEIAAAVVSALNATTIPVNVTKFEGADISDTLLDPNGLVKTAVHDVSSAAGVATLADFFATDTGDTYAGAVSGSVVKEIADNAGGGGGFDPNTTPVQVSTTGVAAIQSGLSTFDPNSTPVTTNSTSIAAIAAAVPSSSFDPNTTPVQLSSAALSAVAAGLHDFDPNTTPIQVSSTGVAALAAALHDFDPNSLPVQISSTALAAIAALLPENFDTVTVADAKIAADASVSLTEEDVNDIADGVLTALGEGIAVNEFTESALAAINAQVDTALEDYNSPTKSELDAGFAALNDPNEAAIAAEVVTELLAETFDGTIKVGDLYDGLLAFLTGKCVIVDNGATSTYTFYKNDGTTISYSLTSADDDGARAVGAIINEE